MSAFALKNRESSFLLRVAFQSANFDKCPYFLYQRKSVVNKPPHCAISVPAATPFMCICMWIAKTKLKTMLSMFISIEIHIGVFESCIPMNQPLIAYMPKVAGAAQMRM